MRITELDSLELSDFINKDTNNFFDLFGLTTDFLKHDPSTWSSNQEYQDILKKVVNLKSVNDVAERGVKLVEEYNGLLTKDQEQQQFMLQIVADYRKRFPKCTKEILSRPLT